MAKSAGYKRKSLEEMKTLSEGRVKALVDYAAYLREREEWEATVEVRRKQSLSVACYVPD